MRESQQNRATGRYLEEVSDEAGAALSKSRRLELKTPFEQRQTPYKVK
jgi:hypothetical protein